MSCQSYLASMPDSGFYLQLLTYSPETLSKTKMKSDFTSDQYLPLSSYLQLNKTEVIQLKKYWTSQYHFILSMQLISYHLLQTILKTDHSSIREISCLAAFLAVFSEAYLSLTISLFYWQMCTHLPWSGFLANQLFLSLSSYKNVLFTLEIVSECLNWLQKLVYTN